ncbi:transcription elongation factor SPT6 homolog [Gossypium arboreum]|uniref:transcription elongation factor SPT6 homolog n=1 Tax=Gossypium arboreum TaxID=29729 RepID=UPI0022F1A4D3|nr:transcription elongation factor SPT6 homolog [Gossypium arboreum]
MVCTLARHFTSVGVVSENLDQFECDGFIVDDEEEEEDKNDQEISEGSCSDDDDGELVQENRIPGICQFPKLDIVGLLFADIFGEEKASFCGQNYEMSDFIVGEEKSYGKGSSLRWLKMNKKKMEQVVTICLSTLDDKVPITDDANQTLNHQKQMIEEIVGPPPLDIRSIEEETIWIHNQLVMNSHILFCKKKTEERSVEVYVLLNKIKKEDIMRFLELHYVEKFDEQCLSLLDDFEQNEAENEDNDDVGQAGQLKWHKVLWIIKELDMWFLLQKRKSVLQMHQRKIYDEECSKIDNSEKYTLNKQLFESISKSLNEAKTKEEIDDVDAKYTLNKLLSGFNIICTIYNLCYLDSFDCRC